MRGTIEKIYSCVHLIKGIIQMVQIYRFHQHVQVEISDKYNPPLELLSGYDKRANSGYFPGNDITYSVRDL